MAAINPTVGDLAGNSAEVVRAAAAAAQEGAHLIVFPEMVLTGYPVEDLALRSSFRQASKKAIAALATELAVEGYGDLVAIVGYLDEASTGGPQNGGVTIPNADGRLVSSYQEAIGMWSTGIREQFRGSSFRNRNVLLAQQVPPALFEGRSLLKPNSSDSPFNLKLSSDRNELVSQEKASLRMYKTIHLFDPAEFLCPASRCITSTSSGQIYTDKYHLSPIGSLYLSDQIKSAIELAIR